MFGHKQPSTVVCYRELHEMKRRVYGLGLLVAFVAMASYAYLVPFGGTRLDYESERADYDPSADYRVDCGDDKFELTSSLWRLPIGMRDVLGGAELSGAEGAFNPSDAGGGSDRRFGLAAVGRSRIFAAVEQGGVGYGVEIWAFRRKDFLHWVGNRVPGGGAGTVPKSLAQFLALTCKG